MASVSKLDATAKAIVAEELAATTPQPASDATSVDCCATGWASTTPACCRATADSSSGSPNVVHCG